MQNPRQVTLKHVADYVGCSKPAVAQVLNRSGGTARVGQELRRRIEVAAQELGYRPNYLGRALSEGRSRMLGLVMGGVSPAELHTGFWGQVIGGLDEGARHAGFHLLIVGDDGPDEDGFSRGVAMLEEGQIECLLVPHLVYSQDAAVLERIEEYPGRLAVLFAADGSRHPGVTVDQRPGLHEAAAHLAELGRRDVLWAGYRVQGAETAAQRRVFFLEAAEPLGLSVRVFHVTHDRREDMNHPSVLISRFYQQTAGWLEQHPAPTAIMAYNEAAALGVYQAVRDHGLRVPQDVSVIGYDDINAEWAYPPMTVVSLQLHEMGREWALLAVASVQQGDRPPQARVVRVPTKLVVRGSTAPAPAHAT